MTMQELWLSEDSISEIAENATKKYAESNRPARFSNFSGEDDQCGRDDQREDRQEDCEIGTDVEGRATVGRVVES